MKTITTTPRLPAPTSKPWTQYLTFDLLYLVLSRSVFHPFICFLVPLCLHATHIPLSAPSIRYSFSWACLVTLYRTLAIWNYRLAYGSARKVRLEDEVVLVAGGGGAGLGRLMAEVYAMKGARGIAVLDVKVPSDGPEKEEWEEMGIRWYKCDVGQRTEVERVRNQILDEFGTHPTIIINCIAARITTSPLTSLTTPEFTSTLTANLTSHFNLLSVFLPPILSSTTTTKNNPKPHSAGATIITLSSILSHFHPANLAPYSASKAALSSLHTTLTAEIRQRGLSHLVKTILVEPGQINTPLFADVVETPSRFLAPVLDTREVCKAVAGLVDAGEGGVVRIPAYAGWAEWFGVLPAAVQRVVRWASGVDRAVVKRADEEEREGKGEKKTHPGHVGLTPRQADAGARDDMTSSGDDMVVVDKM